MRSSSAQRRALERPSVPPPGWKGTAWGDRVDDGVGAGADGWIRKTSRLAALTSASMSSSSSSRTSSTRTSVSSTKLGGAPAPTGAAPARAPVPTTAALTPVARDALPTSRERTSAGPNACSRAGGGGPPVLGRRPPPTSSSRKWSHVHRIQPWRTTGTKAKPPDLRMVEPRRRFQHHRGDGGGWPRQMRSTGWRPRRGPRGRHGRCQWPSHARARPRPRTWKGGMWRGRLTGGHRHDQRRRRRAGSQGRGAGGKSRH
jgi:hypothetical protein